MIPIIPYLQLTTLGEYQDKIVKLYQADAVIYNTTPASIRKETEALLLLVNCYYSNRIEGNPTHPKELIRAQESSSANVSYEILELLQHLEVQMKTKSAQTDANKIISQEYIKSLHYDFYAGLPEAHLKVRDLNGRIARDDSGNEILVAPGEYRVRNVQVGAHIPPEHENLPGYMAWIEAQYKLKNIHGLSPVVAAAGLHHRLAWIHPFQDGNGRAIRLVTDCYMKACFGGYGLWSIVRGFGRNTEAYYSALASADKPNRGTDGRGKLSEKGLLNFTKYFIDTALDQVNFFTGLLEPGKLGIRIDYYFQMRAQGGLPGANGEDLPLLKIAARDIYRLLLEKGPMSRGAICQHLDKGEQTLRPIFKQMEQEKLIKAKPKQDVELLLSPNSLEFLFPNLW